MKAIDKKVQSKIIGFISEKNMKECLMPLPPNGTHSVECEYDLVYHPKLDDKIFVRSTWIEFFNHSMSNKKMKVYEFDAKSGKYLGESNEGTIFANQLTLIMPII